MTFSQDHWQGVSSMKKYIQRLKADNLCTSWYNDNEESLGPVGVHYFI